SVLHSLAGEARRFATAARSRATRRAYACDWNDFVAWCDRNALAALPAEPAIIALYLTDLAKRAKVATLERRLVAIRQAHKASNHESPTTNATVRDVMAGIRRELGTAQNRKAAIDVADLRLIVDALPEGPTGYRDRALLLLGFAGALRRSELVALRVCDVQLVHEGLEVRILHSKTDQEGAGETIGVLYGSNPATCPVRALQAWLERAKIVDGPIFREVDRHGRIGVNALSGDSVARIIQRHVCKLPGRDATRYGGHSLRAGFATSAAAGGASERSIMTQTRHKSVAIARRYVRHGSMWREHAGTVLGL
ncbi:MAG TPA: site-specific integrase, partial [Candidatus Eremiobacteraceae bacterium]|nr:site-specific integrase [Candidatus Eremiobacteraceae bacterium]